MICPGKGARVTMLRSLARRAVEAAARAGLRMLPNRLRLIVLSHAPIVCRLDYAKQYIWLHADSG